MALAPTLFTSRTLILSVQIPLRPNGWGDIQPTPPEIGNIKKPVTALTSIAGFAPSMGVLALPFAAPDPADPVLAGLEPTLLKYLTVSPSIPAPIGTEESQTTNPVVMPSASPGLGALSIAGRQPIAVQDLKTFLPMDVSTPLTIAGLAPVVQPIVVGSNTIILPGVGAAATNALAPTLTALVTPEELTIEPGLAPLDMIAGGEPSFTSSLTQEVGSAPQTEPTVVGGFEPTLLLKRGWDSVDPGRDTIWRDVPRA